MHFAYVFDTISFELIVLQFYPVKLCNEIIIKKEVVDGESVIYDTNSIDDMIAHSDNVTISTLHVQFVYNTINSCH